MNTTKRDQIDVPRVVPRSVCASSSIHRFGPDILTRRLFPLVSGCPCDVPQCPPSHAGQCRQRRVSAQCPPFRATLGTIPVAVGRTMSEIRERGTMRGTTPWTIPGKRGVSTALPPPIAGASSPASGTPRRLRGARWCALARGCSWPRWSPATDETSASVPAKMHAKRLEGFGVIGIPARFLDLNEALTVITRAPVG